MERRHRQGVRSKGKGWEGERG